jgi:uncharacterized protein YndB with AHSA1/START domain
MSASPKLRDVDDREHVISRTFDAPRDLVWKAWTEPQRMAQWWGPNSFTNPVCDLDVRPGGAYRIVMRSPDGADYPLKGVYREVVPPKHLVYTVDISDHPEDWHGLLKQHLEGRPADTSCGAQSELRGGRGQDPRHNPAKL